MSEGKEGKLPDLIGLRWLEAEGLLRKAGVKEVEVHYTSPPWKGRPTGELRVVGVRPGRPPKVILAFEGHKGGEVSRTKRHTS